MLAALDLAHMRAFNAGQVGQRFLGDASWTGQPFVDIRLP